MIIVINLEVDSLVLSLLLLELWFRALERTTGIFLVSICGLVSNFGTPYLRLLISALSDNSRFNFYYSLIEEVHFFSFLDSDGSVVLRPGNKYEYTFGFELPQHG